MEPSPEERAAIQDIPSAASWVGLARAPGQLATPLGALLDALGRPTDARQAVRTFRELFAQAVRDMRVRPAEEGTEPRGFTPVEAGNAEGFRSALRPVVGLPFSPDEARATPLSRAGARSAHVGQKGQHVVGGRCHCRSGSGPVVPG